MPSVTENFSRPRLNFETFQNLDADRFDPADTIQTATDSADAIRTITDWTDRYGRVIRSIRRVRMCVSDWGITKLHAPFNNMCVYCLLTLSLPNFTELTLPRRKLDHPNFSSNREFSKNECLSGETYRFQ